ncbi:MAG: hypothetical protein HY288_17485 [Planctomycetia bacterium]|nr:hypothetical protein [Planctomycetia bacterium]
MISLSDSESPHGDPAAAETPIKAPRGARPRRALAFMLGMVAALGVTAVIFFFAMRSNAPRLTRADYDAAVARWEKNGPADYDLDLELQGNRPGNIHVEVRHGKVVHMIRDGVEPRQQRTWDYWSVPGQLDTIGQDLDLADNPTIPFHVADGSQVVMWAEFDPQLGYPHQYHRVVLGAAFEVHWTVTRFRALGGKK